MPIINHTTSVRAVNGTSITSQAYPIKAGSKLLSATVACDAQTDAIGIGVTLRSVRNYTNYYHVYLSGMILYDASSSYVLASSEVLQLPEFEDCELVLYMDNQTGGNANVILNYVVEVPA